MEKVLVYTIDARTDEMLGVETVEAELITSHTRPGQPRQQWIEYKGELVNVEVQGKTFAAFYYPPTARL